MRLAGLLPGLTTPGASRQATHLNLPSLAPKANPRGGKNDVSLNSETTPHLGVPVDVLAPRHAGANLASSISLVRRICLKAGSEHESVQRFTSNLFFSLASTAL